MAAFRDPILKLERAKHHISDLVSQCNNFCNSMTVTFFIEDDRKTHQRTLRVKINEAVPDQFALIMGDAIHNMRTALDHLTWDVLRSYGPNADKVQFPFCRKAESFESVLKNRQIHLAGEQIVQKFRDLKPYSGGNDLLYALHMLDITDKHELIVPTVSRFCFDVFDARKFDPSAPAGLRRENIAFPVWKDNRLAVWQYDPKIPWKHPEQTKQIDVGVQITFPKEIAAIGGKSIPAILRRMAMMVSGIIRNFRN